MKKSRTIILLMAAGILAASAASHSHALADEDPIVPAPARQYLPREVRDTAGLNNSNAGRRNYESTIHLLARTYGDSIVLRWAPEDYVSWQYLNAVGVNIYRMPVPDGKNPDAEFRIDTLAFQMKPASLERWQALYPETDSVAMVGMGTLYSTGGFSQEQSKYPTGDMGALLDVYEDQQFRFGMAVLASEWRKDVAENLAMRFVDKKVKKGRKYRYIVRPTEMDTTGNLQFRVGYIDEIENTNYVPEPYRAVMGDSVVGIDQLRIWWQPTDRFSSYDIHRRAMGQQQWTKVNDNPYVMMRDFGDKDIDNFINDNVRPGTYEYRISGYDAFGDLVTAQNYMWPPCPTWKLPGLPS